jgi:hypothetical protein
VVSDLSFRSKLPTVLGLLAVLLLLPGCPLSPDKEENKDEEVRLDNPTTVQGTMNRLSQVWENKLFREYELLLHDQFRFSPLDVDRSQFPWLPDDFWGRTTELEFANNMFDSDFTGNQPPVESITWSFSILRESNVADANGNPAIEVETTAVITVLTGPDQGFSSDTRFIFLLTADPNFPGQFQVLEQREVPRQS